MTLILIGSTFIVFYLNLLAIRKSKNVKFLRIETKVKLISIVEELKKAMCNQKLVFYHRGHVVFSVEKKQNKNLIQLYFTNNIKIDDSINLGSNTSEIIDYLLCKYSDILECFVFFEKSSTLLIEN